MSSRMCVASSWDRIAAALAVVALAVACNTPSRGSSPANPAPSVASASKGAGHCGDVVGAWSPVVGGLRGRLVTSGSRADLSALDITLELENVSGGPLEMSWSGPANLGFATFRLEDEGGTAVPKPVWALGGNEAVGNLREVLPAVGIARHEVSSSFGRMMGERILRIGAFWGYPMPSDGSRRLLRARVTGAAPHDAGWTEVAYPAVGDAGASVRAAPPGEPGGNAWMGTLEIPAVCIE